MLNSLVLVVLLPIFQSTPSVGRATKLYNKQLESCLFQSTPSVGRATLSRDSLFLVKDISIHALRGEGDIILLKTV